MTVQIPDKFKFNSKIYDLLQEDEDIFLFNPHDYGFDAYDKASFCWKGHLSTYSIKDNKLVLSKLEINNTDKVKLNNENPKRGILLSIIYNTKLGSMIDGFDYKYNNINLDIDYTGTLLIGRDEVECDFDYDYYYYNYVMSPHSYNEVIKLEFSKGKLINTIDISVDMINLRERLSTEYKNKTYYDTEVDYSELDEIDELLVSKKIIRLEEINVEDNKML